MLPVPGPKNGQANGNNGFFITQKGEKMAEVKREIAELEALLAGATQTSQSTLLLKKRKEMREVDEALELMKEEFKNRMEACEERRMQFELKQAKMREQVLKFEKFIQENDAKRQRAEKKTKEERKTYEIKCQELNMLNKKIEDMENAQKDLEKQLQRKACYRIYLEQFLDAGDVSYEEVSDILSRYDTLKGANRDLMIHVDTLENDVNELRSKLQNLKIETQNNLLVSNSLLQSNQKELEELKTTLKRDEKEKELYEDKAKNIARETSQVIQSIKNVYYRCQSTMRNKSNTNNLIINPTNQRDNTNAIQNTSMPNGPTATSSATTQHGGSNGINFNNLNEMLSSSLDLIHSRVSDLIEITNEYKQQQSQQHSTSGPIQGGLGGALSMMSEGGGLTPGGNSHFGGLNGSSGVGMERNLVSKSAPSGQFKGKK